MSEYRHPGYTCPVCGLITYEWVDAGFDSHSHWVKPYPICVHDFVIEPNYQPTTSNIPPTKWRCKKCLETRMTYD